MPAEHDSSPFASDDDLFSTTTTTSVVVKEVQLPSKLPLHIASYQSLPDREQHENFLRNCLKILLEEAVFKGTQRDTKVVNWQSPDELKQIIDFVPRNTPESHEELQQIIKDIVQYSVKTGHPYFVNQLFSSLDVYGLVGQWLTDALNPSVYTYEVAPVFVLMEEEVLREMRRIVGFENGKGDGIFCPGGSMANGYAISCARYQFCPEIKVSSRNNSFVVGLISNNFNTCRTLSKLIQLDFYIFIRVMFEFICLQIKIIK